MHKRKKSKKRSAKLYMKMILSKKLTLPFKLIGNNIDTILANKLSRELEGKCNNEGFIKPGSVSLITYSSGIIKGNDVLFDISYECHVCRPVEGLKISCIIRNVTKAGIRAEINSKHSPLIIFIARDHHHQSKYFSKQKEGNIITIRVIGQRFELNDKYISVIATLVEPKSI
jgi:DNA-directed RNA polymerase subunit E'/Rpb7